MMGQVKSLAELAKSVPSRAHAMGGYKRTPEARAVSRRSGGVALYRDFGTDARLKGSGRRTGGFGSQAMHERLNCE